VISCRRFVRIVMVTMEDSEMSSGTYSSGVDGKLGFVIAMLWGMEETCHLLVAVGSSQLDLVRPIVGV
jgi:hypothetical protein